MNAVGGVVHQFICTACDREVSSPRQKSGRCAACQTKRKTRAMKARAVEYMGGCCARCGYDVCQGSLHFHHVKHDRRQRPTIAAIIRGGRSWGDVVAALQDCELLCANCHGEHHWGGVI